MSKVVITMPAYHAGDTLEKTVADIPPNVADELILVDDASADNTANLARDLGIHVYVHPHNRGYGANQKTCYAKALEHEADVVVLLHPDYQYDPKAVPLLIAPILAGYADMTFGSRFAGLGDPLGGGMPRYRFVGNRITTQLENVMLGSRFSEMHSGLRAYTRDCLLSLPFLGYTDDFAFDSQMTVDAVTAGLRVVEVPIPTRYTKESSSISILRSLKYVGQSLGYSALRATSRGRRGRRWPVAPGARLRAPGDEPGEPVEQRCVLCDSPEMRLVYPSNVHDEVQISEFACTSDALAQHDDILRCPRCGMVSSHPTISTQQVLVNYAVMHDDGYLEEEQGRRDLFDWVLAQMEGFLIPGRRLLEVGSNVGLFLDAARARGWSPMGVEPSKWAVDLGRQRFGVELREGTAADVAEPAASADAIVMLDVLEHLSDPVADLRHLRPVLHDSGLLALSTVNLESIHARARADDWPWFIRPHLHYFSPPTLKQTLVRAGYRMVHWSVVPRWFHLSYVAGRAGSSHGALSRAAGKVAGVVDPKIPVGWLGDVIFVVARKTTAARLPDLVDASAGPARADRIGRSLRA
jgi:2-polyprenyl-3-methyl-5-hydroxy-6-metoxy-1,4-benzoquinol methylase